MFFLTILLLFCFQVFQQIQNATADGREILSNPILTPVQGTLEVVMNQNVSLSCHSNSGSPPVKYTLFKCNQKISTLNRTDLMPALFNLTISSASDVGEYKCKAEDTIDGKKYSRSLSFTLKEPLSKPVLSSLTSQAKKGQNATLSCLSEKGSLPITYTFFKGKQSISQPVRMQKKEAAVIFVLINSHSDLETYKCRAESSFLKMTKYSNSFNFTLAEESCDSQPRIIFLGLIIPAFVIGFALVIRFFFIPSCKAEPIQKEECANFSVSRREDEKEKRESPTIYSKVVIRDGIQAGPLHSPE
ncbi:allergin-1 isoform X2 [Oxyura jamaicensis]|uniref:allergin-1 isoform X2 n=1 Tax=Oxyura jamaicensis TaxID=8884 RepID=UPI0015A721DB|nr:allergin-1 isoform X2 [Oxyura jamaicensis]